MEFAEFISIPKLDGVILHSPFCTKFNGTLCITGHHIILSSRQEGAEELWVINEIGVKELFRIQEYKNN